MDQHCLIASWLRAYCEQPAPDCLAKSHPSFQITEKKKKKKGVSAGGSSDVLPLGVYEKVPVELESHAALTLVFIKW